MVIVMEELIIKKLLENEAPTSVLIVGLAIYIVRVIRRIEFDIHSASRGISDIKAEISYLRGKGDSNENSK